jgi:hypothetical protein
MRLNKWWLGLAGGGILLVGLLAGALMSGGVPAWAAGALTGQVLATQTTTPQGNYCQVYMQALAKSLNVPESTLAQANQSALKSTIQQAYQDGKISQAQETRLLNQVNSATTHPCAFAGIGRALGGNWGGARTQLKAARQAVLAAVANKLGLSVNTLQSDLRAGQTLGQIAQNQHVALSGTSGLNAVYLATVQQQLNQAAKNGGITQAQATSLYQQAQQGVSSGRYFLMAGGSRGHGPQGSTPTPQ